MNTVANKTIYVVDDDTSILEILSIILKDHGYNVIVSTDGSSLDSMGTIPDLIILDIRLAGSDGSEICRQCKQDARLASVPIILVSANLDGEDIARSCGADAFLSKPFELKEILGLAHKHIAEAR